MASGGICELCGYGDDSYRISDESGTVMKVCKFCHDGYLERMGLAPDSDKPVENLALTLELPDGFDAEYLEGMSGEELLQLKTELEERKQKTRVKTLDSQQLDSLLGTDEQDKKVLDNVRQKENRRKNKNFKNALDDTGEDYKASEKLIGSGEELQKAVEGLDDVDSLDVDPEEFPLIARLMRKREERNAPTEATETAEKAEAQKETAAAKEEFEEAEEPSKKQEESEDRTETPTEEETPDNAESPTEEETPDNKKESEQENENSEEENMSDKKKAVAQNREEALTREERAREKVRAAAHQSIDDERIRITSPEVELRKDKRPKTNFDVATAENTGAVRFFDAFKYVMHQVTYAVLVGLIVLAVSTVVFIRESWQHGLIVLGGGIGAVAVGFLLMWYLSHCYSLDRRAQLLRIRQQEILFDSMDGECYRELRTKFTVIKALGWLLNKLSVLLPLVVFVGGNIAAVIVSFVFENMYWLLPVVSAGASVGGVLVYYVFKFLADTVAYKLDRERNEQIQQQTLLDILNELRKNNSEK